MLILYIRHECSYCEKVIKVFAELGVAFEQRDIADRTIASELIKRGGKQQVPYLVDSEKGIEMYESEYIVDYVRSLPHD